VQRFLTQFFRGIFGRSTQRDATQRNTTEPKQDNTAGNKARTTQAIPFPKTRQEQRIARRSNPTQLNGDQQNTNNKRQERKRNTTGKTQRNERELNTTSEQNRYNA